MRQPMDLRRRAPHRATKRAFLVVYAGRIQGFYLHWIKKTLDHAEIPLEPVAETLSPLSIVQSTRRLRDVARRSGNRYDEVWCLLDEHPDLPEALRLAGQHKIRVVISRPTFAVWLLLHFEGVDASARAQHVLSRLAGYMPGPSDGGSGLGALAGKYDEARHRASTPGSAESNMYELVESIRDSLRQYLGRDEAEPL